MSQVLDRQTLEFVRFPVVTAPVDPATLTHEVAVVDEFAQLPSVWVTVPYVNDAVEMLVRASLDAPDTVPPGGADFTLAQGRWRVWWKTDSDPEYPVRRVGIIEVV